MKFTVDRAKLGRLVYWLPDGSPCCILGHYAQSLGHKANKGEPFPKWLLEHDTYGTVWHNVVRTNDHTSDFIARERKLISLFAEGGVDLTFTGEYANG